MIGAESYPEGADPCVLGESANSITTYVYDVVTRMQEPKLTLCQIAATYKIAHETIRIMDAVPTISPRTTLNLAEFSIYSKMSIEAR